MALEFFEPELAICVLLKQHGITHKRDERTAVDQKHTLYLNGEVMGRYDVHEACALLERLRTN